MGTAGQTWNSLGKIERDIRVLCDRGDFEKIDYVQGTNAIPIILHIRDYDIPAGCTARVYVKRPDGTVEYDNAEISGNDVEVNVKNSMFSVAGNSVLQIKITKESSVLVTFGLTVCVKQNYIDDSFKSENGTDIFDSMTEEMKAYMEDAKEDSANSAAASGNFSKLSESWAHGDTGVRDGEGTNNSKYFSDLAKALTDEAKKSLDQAQNIISAAVSGALIPAGTVAFADLPADPMAGYMYNISDDFTTDSRFEEGPGVGYKAGANIYWTADGKWDVMVGSQVIGVKGAAEDEYRVGLVNITPEGIGLPDNVQEQLNSKIDSSRIVKSTNITEEGFLMDGKYLSERLNKINKFSDYEAASKPYLPFTNILTISPEEKNSANQKKYAIYQNPTIGILDDMPLPLRNVESFIYRDISYYDTNHVLVTLTEAHPVPGRVWTAFYDYGTWRGWKCNQGITLFKGDIYTTGTYQMLDVLTNYPRVEMKGFALANGVTPFKFELIQQDAVFEQGQVWNLSVPAWPGLMSYMLFTISGDTITVTQTGRIELATGNIDTTVYHTQAHVTHIIGYWD